MVTVPFLDVGAGYRELRGELDEAYSRVMNSGRYVLGDEVEAFESEFAAFCGAERAVGVGNGLDAISLVLRAAGIGPGDEVIVPAHTFIATWLAVVNIGATVVAVDVQPESLLIDVGAAATAITPRTAAIIPVHLYGRPADMTALGELAGEHGLLLLGDAAQAHGARHRGRDVGSLGSAAAFSFYPAKNLGAFGDGGAVTTSDLALAARVRRLRQYGARARYTFDEPGVNSRLDPLQAAFLRVKLKAVARWNRRRTEIARMYLSELSGVPNLRLPNAEEPTCEPAWHLFCVRHPDRDALAAHLERADVATHIHYPIPPHLSPAFAHLRLGRGAFPVTEEAAASLLSLPIGPHLTDEDVGKVIRGVRSFSA